MAASLNGRIIFAVVLMTAAFLPAVFATAVPLVGPLVVLFAAAVAILTVIPPHFLPPIALTAYALVPVNYLPGSRITSELSPALLVMLVWEFKMLLAKPATAWWPRFPVIATALWLVLGIALSIARPVSVGWALNFMVFVLLPVFMARRASAKTAPLLLRTWIGLASVLATVGIIEGLIRRNPIPWIGDHYNFEQVWATYRITTTLGHPLANGTFFAMACALCWSQVLATRALQYLVPFALTGTAMLLCVSRAALFASVLAVILVTAVWFRWNRGLGQKLLAVCLLSAAIFYAFGNDTIRYRSASAEGAASAQLRVSVISLSQAVVRQTHYLGVGPGASSHTQDKLIFDRRVRFESAALQLYVDGGIPGLIGVGSLILSSAVVAIRRRRLGGLATLTAFTVSVAGYEFLEDPNALLLMGLPFLLISLPRVRQGSLKTATREARGHTHTLRSSSNDVSLQRAKAGFEKL